MRDKLNSNLVSKFETTINLACYVNYGTGAGWNSNVIYTNKWKKLTLSYANGSAGYKDDFGVRVYGDNSLLLTRKNITTTDDILDISQYNEIKIETYGYPSTSSASIAKQKLVFE